MKFGSIQETAGRSPLAARCEEAAMPEEVLPVEVARDRLAGEPVGRVDHPERRDVVVRVPAPTDVASSRWRTNDDEVVRPRGLEVVAMTRRRACRGVAAVRHRRAADGAEPVVADAELVRRGRRRPAAARPCGRPSRGGRVALAAAAWAASSSSSRRSRSSSRPRSARRRPARVARVLRLHELRRSSPHARDTTCRGPLFTLPAVAPRRRLAPRRG